jgi:aminoglycoside phosphotransferase family enzyme/predicted kinase
MDQSTIIDWLRAGGPWGEAPKVEETHAAYVFLTGERAFKLKKAVNLGYLDFSTPEKRKHTLERELKLNRRTAHEMYRRVLPITENAGKLALDGQGRAVDFVLEMKRFGDGALLSEWADHGKLDVAMAEKLAHQIAAFHAAAEVVSNVDWPKAASRIADENLRDMRDQPNVFDPASLRAHVSNRDHVHDAGRESLKYQSEAVRRCHGDLHLRNAFVEHGRPVLFDCIEFDEFYASIPPLYDLAFLIMDLWSRGLHAQANRALNAWIMDQPPPRWHGLLMDLAALPAYLTWRAEIRAKTEGRRPDAIETARRYFKLASEFATATKPALIAVGGLSGTGKSTLARALAPDLGRAPGAIHLRTDEIRKRQAGVSLDAHLAPAAYTAERTARVYAMMEDLASAALHAGQAVIADAVFAREDERQAIEAVAAKAGVPFIGLWLEAPTPALETRLQRRTGDASDADKAVLHRQLTYNLGQITWTKLDAGQSAHALAEAARKCVAYWAGNVSAGLSPS